jgi:hypothetical protein
VKRFEQRELREAIAYAKEGGQALHVHRMNMNGHRLFSRYPEIAHLLDQDLSRLVATARSLGVRVIKVEKRQTESQHIDLCGKPFEKAKAIAANLQREIEYECT